MRSAFSALFFLPLVFAVSNLSVSPNLSSGGPVTITWTADPTDPATCSFELANQAFHNTFAIANNIPINTGSITVNLPAVPTAQYTLEAVQIDNVTNVLGTSAPFTIGPPVSSSTSSASTSSPASSSVSAASATGSSASAQTSSSSGSRASSSTSSSATPSSFNGNGNGALSHIDSSNVGSIAAIVMGIAAGAVFV